MPEIRVNYDEIASTYDQRYSTGVGEAQHTIPPALRQLLRPGIANTILEVGCGTGYWFDVFGANHQLVGIDLSSAMLARAKTRKRNATLTRGDAGYLPFAGGTFDLVYCVNAFHHFPDKEGFVSEAGRVLRAGGTLVIIGMDPHTQADEWYIYDYFEGTRELDLMRFASSPQVAGWMRKQGFVEIGSDVVERILNHQRGSAVLNHSVLQKNGTSQLALLSDEAYTAGLDRLKKDLAAADQRGEVLIFPEDISLVMVSAVRALSEVPE